MVTEPIRRVHVVAKTHLDLGFTALASEVVDSYLSRFFPAAIATAGELRERSAPLGLVWTTGSWILREALDRDPNPEARAEVAAAVERGELAWHSLPLTFHTELLDAELLEHGLSISSDLDTRFGRVGVAAKMTDVPGHTRSMIPALAAAGVRFLHLGVNPAWPVPEVPPAFRWRAPEGQEVVVAYQAGGYGGDVVLPGCDEVLSFLHSGDNLGPPTASEVLDAHRILRDRYPGAEIVASTLDAYATALLRSGAAANLPVVTAEIGDPWIFGAASDPTKLADFRQLLRCRRSKMLDPDARREVDDALLLVAEHTWGLDEKIAVVDPTGWDGIWLADFRASAAGERFESSWAEQRSYVERAASAMASAGIEAEVRPSWRAGFADGLATAEGPHRPGDVAHLGGWTVAFDGTGAVEHLVSPTGRVVADGGHRLGALRHQTFDEADYERFRSGLRITEDDAWWANRDNGKPGIDASGASSATWVPVFESAAVDGERNTLTIRVRFDGDATGAPPVICIRWRFLEDRIEVGVGWPDKEPTRLPEALWIDWNPLVDRPDAWMMDKLSSLVSPMDVVRHGGRRLHAVGHGLHHHDGEHSLHISCIDTPLVAPGGAALLDADPSAPDLDLGFSVLLHDNCWGTNFPMWVEGSALHRFEIDLGRICPASL